MQLLLSLCISNSAQLCSSTLTPVDFLSRSLELFVFFFFFFHFLVHIHNVLVQKAPGGGRTSENYCAEDYSVQIADNRIFSYINNLKMSFHLDRLSCAFFDVCVWILKVEFPCFHFPPASVCWCWWTVHWTGQACCKFTSTQRRML